MGDGIAGYTHWMTMFAVSDEAIFIAFVILMLVALALSLTRRGNSQISSHPTDDRGAAPGAEGSSAPDHDHTAADKLKDQHGQQ